MSKRNLKREEAFSAWYVEFKVGMFGRILGS